MSKSDNLSEVISTDEIRRFFFIGIIAFAEILNSEANAVSMASVDFSGTKGNIENCVITVLDAYIWRNWMPFLESSEPDGGSPLHTSIRLRFDNSKGKATKLSLSAVVLSDDNIPYPVVFDAMRDEHENVWDGSVVSGENKIIEMLANEGPYLQVGSKASVVLTFTNQVGVKALLKIPALAIERAD